MGAVLESVGAIVLVLVLGLLILVVRVSKDLKREAVGPRPGKPQHAICYYLMSPAGGLGRKALESFLDIERRMRKENGYRALAIHPNGCLKFLGLEGLKVTHLRISQGLGDDRREFHSFHLTGCSGEFGRVFEDSEYERAIRKMLAASFKLAGATGIAKWSRLARRIA